jgi:hypothetical protein
MNNEEEHEDDGLSEEDWNERLRRHARKANADDSHNEWRGDVVVEKAGVDVEALRRKLAEREQYRRRAEEAISKAETDGRLSAFNAESARLTLRRRIARGKTSLSLESHGMGMSRVQEEITGPWNEFIRELGSLGAANHDEDEECEEDEPEEDGSDDLS